MVAMAMAGIVEIVVALKLMYRSCARQLLCELDDANDDVAVQFALKGIESIFVAPVGFLAIHCISIYIMRRMKAGRCGEIDNVDDRPVAELKAWTLSLMIAVVATDLIGRLVGKTPFERERVIAECVVITVLAAVWWMVYGRREPP